MHFDGKTENPPILSIIIATLNVAQHLRKTLASIPQQSPFAYQIIIQDGNSSDGTCAVAQDFANLPLSIESAPDCGIYDAWNKALARVRGEWIIFIGAGDLLDWPALARCVATLPRLADSIEYYSTPITFVTSSGIVREMIKPSSTPLKHLPQYMSLPHPGLFHRSTLFLKQKFDVSYRIAGDYEFLCRTVHENNVSLGNTPFVFMQVGGISGNMNSMYISETEFLRTSRKYFPRVLPYKPLLRLARSSGYRAVRWLFGPRMAGYYADIPRIVQGKTRLWSLPATQDHVALPPLPDHPVMDLLIATLGRVTELERLFTSLETQVYKNFRILLADQNPPGFLDAMLARHPNLPIQRILLPSRGLSIARNALLEIAKGEILIFPDDDCWYAPDTLQQVYETFRANPFCGALLGVWSSSPGTPPRSMREGVISKVGMFVRAETYVQFFRKEVVTGIRFDPMLGPGTGLPYGSGEDTDYLLNVSIRTEVRRHANILIFHPSPKENLPSHEKIARYASGRMYLLKKHKFSKFFILLNVLYPLCCIPADFLRHGKAYAVYRWRIFRERMRNLTV